MCSAEHNDILPFSPAVTLIVRYKHRLRVRSLWILSHILLMWILVRPSSKDTFRSLNSSMLLPCFFNTLHYEFTRVSFLPMQVQIDTTAHWCWVISCFIYFCDGTCFPSWQHQPLLWHIALRPVFWLVTSELNSQSRQGTMAQFTLDSFALWLLLLYYLAIVACVKMDLTRKALYSSIKSYDSLHVGLLCFHSYYRSTISKQIPTGQWYHQVCSCSPNPLIAEILFKVISIQTHSVTYCVDQALRPPHLSAHHGLPRIISLWNVS